MSAWIIEFWCWVSCGEESGTTFVSFCFTTDLLFKKVMGKHHHSALEAWGYLFIREIDSGRVVAREAVPNSASAFKSDEEHVKLKDYTIFHSWPVGNCSSLEYFIRIQSCGIKDNGDFTTWFQGPQLPTGTGKSVTCTLAAGNGLSHRFTRYCRHLFYSRLDRLGACLLACGEHARGQRKRKNG